MKAAFDAIIVGAGPAGSCAAIVLARAGWRIALLEKQRFPRRKVCGECVAASNLPLLHTLGVGHAFSALAGAPLRQVAWMQGNHCIESALPAGPDPEQAWGRALSREWLDPMLLEQARASGALVLQPWALDQLTGRQGHWQCRATAVDSRAVLALQAPVLIDAHGSWERWPGGLPTAPGMGSDLLAFKATFHDADFAPGRLAVLSFRGGYGGMVLADRGLTTLACCIRRDRLAALRQEQVGVAAGLVLEAMLQRECAGVAEALQSARRVGAWMAAGPLRTGIRLTAQDRILRIGNAAGEAHPVIGEGMSMALQSGWLLSQHLLASKQRARGAQQQQKVARAYALQWQATFAPRLRLAALCAHVAMRPGLTALASAALKFWPHGLSHLARWGGKVQVPAGLSMTQRPAPR